MAHYIAQVYLVVEASDVSEALDALSASLSENLKYSNAIVEWSYGKPPSSDGYDLPRRLEIEIEDLEEEDLPKLYAEAKTTPEESI